MSENQSQQAADPARGHAPWHEPRTGPQVPKNHPAPDLAPLTWKRPKATRTTTSRELVSDHTRTPPTHTLERTSTVSERGSSLQQPPAGRGSPHPQWPRPTGPKAQQDPDPGPATHTNTHHGPSFQCPYTDPHTVILCAKKDITSFLVAIKLIENDDCSCSEGSCDSSDPP